MIGSALGFVFELGPQSQSNLVIWSLEIASPWRVGGNERSSTFEAK
jgi:hypothetical protein